MWCLRLNDSLREDWRGCVMALVTSGVCWDERLMMQLIDCLNEIHR